MSERLTHFSLFTGIGGIDLAGEWAGFETVGQCEWADYPTKVLEKHWPNVPRWRDIRSVTAESVKAAGINGITLISGGFPCQPFSVAGKQRGKDDDRYLWPEMLRVISELKPSWVIGENVPGIVNMALDKVLTDLEGQGYTCQPFIIPACGVDARHRRERVFIVADSSIEGSGGLSIRPWGSFKTSSDINRSCKDVLNSNGGRQLPFAESHGQCGKTLPLWGRWWTTEPNVGRVANGIPSRVDRLKCLGNAVVPQQVYPILQAIADIEKARLD